MDELEITKECLKSIACQGNILLVFVAYAMFLIFILYIFHMLIVQYFRYCIEKAKKEQ